MTLRPGGGRGSGDGGSRGPQKPGENGGEGSSGGGGGGGDVASGSDSGATTIPAGLPRNNSFGQSDLNRLSWSSASNEVSLATMVMNRTAAAAATESR